MTDNSGLFGPEVIFSYSRAEAIEDGVLIDVTKTAKEAGFKWNTCVTSAVWGMIQPSDEVKAKFGCDTDGRLWDVLWMAFMAIKQAKQGGRELIYEVILPQHPADTFLKDGADYVRGSIRKFKLHVGPGDDAEPVITIMTPGED